MKSKMINSNFKIFIVALFFAISIQMSAGNLFAQSVFTSGTGTVQNPYVISTVEQLDAVRNHLSNHFILANDIDIQGAEWVRLGNSINRFTGTLDGKGYTVKNYKIDRSGAEAWEEKQDVGLFGFMGAGSKITNLNITGADVKGGSNVGLLAGRSDGGIIENIRVSGVVYGEDNVGGLVGLIRFAAIVNESYSNARVTGNEQAGGLVGSNYQGEIHNSTSEATVFGGSGYGGLVGSNSGLLINGKSYGAVSGIVSWSSGGAGGLVGYNYGEIRNSYSKSILVQGTSGVGGLVGSNNGLVIHSFSTSIITGSSYEIGGLVGVNGGTIEQCYSIADLTGAVSIGGLVGRNGNFGSNDGAIIKNSYAIGNIRATSVLAGSTDSFIGGAIGYKYFGVAENVYFVGRLESPLDEKTDIAMGSTINSVWNSSLNPNYIRSGALGLNETEMRDLNNYLSLGWDFAEIWDIAEGSFPFLRSVLTETIPGIMNDWQFEIQVSSETGFYSHFQSVFFGQSRDATDGFDLNVDVPLPPPAPLETIRAYIRNHDMANILGDEFKMDIRAAKDITKVPEVWRIEIEKPDAGDINVSIRRPLGLDLPFAVHDGTEWHVVRYGDLSLSLVHDGSSNLILGVEVGDLTPPQLNIETTLSGAAIWDTSVERNIAWTAFDENYLESVLVEVSDDNGSSWSEIYLGLDSDVSWIPPSVAINENIKFRVTASDRVGLITQYVSEYPITVASKSQILSFESGWQLVGAPFSAIDILNSTFQPSTYRYGWDNLYVETSFYQPFRGYWLGSTTIGEDIIAGTVTEESITTNLYEGWNLFASPMLRTTYLDSIKVRNLDLNETLSFIDAVMNGWITYPYEYANKQYVVAEEFVPFSGYWIGLLVDQVEVQIPIHRYRESDVLQKNEFTPYIYLTVSGNSLEQTLKLNTELVEFYPIPPPTPTGNYVGLVGAETQLGSLYLSSSISKEKNEYTLIDRDSSQEVYQISWHEQSNPYLDVTLLMPDGSTYPLSTSGYVTWASGKPTIITTPKTTSIIDELDIPNEVTLNQNYPNPFNPSTTVTFSIPEATNVRLEVFSVTGQRLAVLLDGYMAAGSHNVNYDASKLSSGVYIYRLTTKDGILTRSMTLIK
jgi:hypothetical protein